MTSVSNRFPYAEQLYKKNQVESAEYPLNFSRLNKLVPNPVYPPKLQYYSSVVQNSHQFPNLGYIRPYHIEDIPVNPWVGINKSIEDNKKMFFGEQYHTVRDIKLWS